MCVQLYLYQMLQGIAYCHSHRCAASSPSCICDPLCGDTQGQVLKWDEMGKDVLWSLRTLGWLPNIIWLC